MAYFLAPLAAALVIVVLGTAVLVRQDRRRMRADPRDVHPAPPVVSCPYDQRAVSTDDRTGRPPVRRA
ncbi:hypothetical protein [Streptomyces prunicolor]|uniref:hypothetical protein n=1 Tax=Streptomyces prunicolor TaxID=67348 RepID=UPI000378CE6D|nr:hypothetical protein [Streptomyces prunicolor]